MALQEELHRIDKEERESKVNVVRLTLRAIAQGSSAAREKFPRLMQLLNEPSVGKIFNVPPELLPSLPIPSSPYSLPICSIPSHRFNSLC